MQHQQLKKKQKNAAGKNESTFLHDAKSFGLKG